MRHDTHFIDEITANSSEAVGRFIEIGQIRPNPDQPRKAFGDLSEMVESVKEKGILEPILVRYSEEEQKYEIIAGERRFQAASLAGLLKVPCIEVDVDNRGMLEISLVENLQRKDLNPFEEASAILRLSEQFRYTHEEIARKLGKSRTVITEALSLNRIPADVQERCRQADIMSKSMLLQIVRQDSRESMHHLVDKITGEGITREEARKFNKGSGAAKSRVRRYSYNYKPVDKPFRFNMTFDRKDVDKEDVILALKDVLENLVQELEIERFEAGAGRKTGRKRAPKRRSVESRDNAELT
jgi:ParB family chromosome partitioning protein